MDGSLNEVLAHCLEALDRGEMSIDQCVQRYPEHATAIAECLNASQRLHGSPKAVAPLHIQYRGQQRLAAALEDIEQGEKRSMIPGFSNLLSRATALVVAGSLL